MDPSDLSSLIAAHRWPIVAALLVAAVIRGTKEDLQKTPTIPARWRPVVALALGIASGVADAVVAGTPWLTALIGGLVAGLLPVAGNEVLVEGLLGQRTKLAARTSSSPPAPPAPPAPPSASPPPPAGPPPGSILMRRAFAPVACAAGLLLGGVFVSGCAAAAPVLVVADVVDEAASLAAEGLKDVKPWVDDYFVANPDPALQAKVLMVLQRAGLAAQALAQLASGVAAVDEGQYLAALTDFRTAWADLLEVIRGLPNAEVVTSPSPKLTVGVASTPKKRVLVTKPVSAFWPRARKASK